MLAEVGGELDDAHARVAALNGFQRLERSVAAAIVDEHDLGGLGQCREHAGDRRVALADHRVAAVEDRDDNRNHGVWRPPRIVSARRPKNAKTASATAC